MSKPIKEPKDLKIKAPKNDKEHFWMIQEHDLKEQIQAMEMNKKLLPVKIRETKKLLAFIKRQL